MTELLPHLLPAVTLLTDKSFISYASYLNILRTFLKVTVLEFRIVVA